MRAAKARHDETKHRRAAEGGQRVPLTRLANQLSPHTASGSAPAVDMEELACSNQDTLPPVVSYEVTAECGLAHRLRSG